jgi:uncharacterized phage-associated protein
MANLQDVAKCFLCLDEANSGDGISNLKLQKLVYYAQGFYSALFDKALFSNSISAWAHGPVVDELYQNYKCYGRDHIPVPTDFMIDSLTKDEYELIEEVFDIYGQYSAWKLRNMTHEESPWLAHEAQADVIPLSEITEFFKNKIN